VDMCLSENKMAEAILLAIAGGPELLSRTQQRYFQKNGTNLGRVGVAYLRVNDLVCKRVGGGYCLVDFIRITMARAAVFVKRGHCSFIAFYKPMNYQNLNGI